MNQGTAGKSRAVVVLCSALSLIVGGALVYFTTRAAPADAPILVSTPPPTSTALPTSTAAPLRIHVSGAVRRPDVYALPPGSIVKDAIEAAGGATGDADLARINLAQELRDQQQVYVPRLGETNPPPPISGGQGGGGVSGGRVNINTASAAELETLPRVGPATAQKIIAYREANGPFKAISEIQNVPGIGPATFEGMKDLITVGP